MALLFNPRLLSRNSLLAFRRMSDNVHGTISSGQAVDRRSLFASVQTLGDTFESQGQKHLLNSEGAILAQSLAARKEYDLSSIIYGILIKRNKENPFLLEEFAKKALASAKKTKDAIHIMARADDLNNLYRITEYGSKKHLKVLFEEKNALLSIINNYEGAIRNYRTISRKPLSKEHYEFMLCGIRMEIAKILEAEYPLQAIKELEAAQRLISKYGEGTLTYRISNLLDRAYSGL